MAVISPFRGKPIGYQMGVVTDFAISQRKQGSIAEDSAADCVIKPSPLLTATAGSREIVKELI
jgi:hypothetical protein